MKISIVTHEYPGLYRCGGIGTACLHLARFLVQEGHEVEVIYAVGPYTEDGSPFASFQELYRQQGISLLPLPDGLAAHTYQRYKRDSYAAYHFLKERHYDVVHCPDYRAVGYYSLLARQQGLAFPGTRFIIHTHSPTFWHEVAPSAIRSDQLELAYMERTAAELADVVTSPSVYMLDYVHRQGWQLPRTACVIPNLQMKNSPILHAQACTPAPIAGFTYFGRLESRKGLPLFISALKLFMDRTTGPLRAIFVGREGDVPGLESATGYIRGSLAGYENRLQLEIHTTLDTLAAQALLASTPGQLVCMPSLQENAAFAVMECLDLGIPFIASDVGGTAELIDPQDCKLYLFVPRPDVLAAHMERWFGQFPQPPRANSFNAQAPELWRRLNAELAVPRTAVAAPAPRQLVSVTVSTCPPHPHLGQVLSALAAQTYENYEVTVRTVGTPVAAVLGPLQVQYAPRGWDFQSTDGPVTCNGEYWLWLEDLVLLRPAAIATLVQAMTQAGADVALPAGQAADGSICLAGGNALLPGLLPDAGPLAVVMVSRRVLDEVPAIKPIPPHPAPFINGESRSSWLARVALSGRRLWVVPEVLADLLPGSEPKENQLAYFQRLQGLAPYEEALLPVLHDLPRLAMSLQDELADLQEFRRPVYQVVRRQLRILSRFNHFDRLARWLFDSVRSVIRIGK